MNKHESGSGCKGMAGAVTSEHYKYKIQKH